MENGCALGPAAEPRVLPRCSVVVEGGAKETTAMAAKVVAAEEEFSEGSAPTRNLPYQVNRSTNVTTSLDYQARSSSWCWGTE